MEAPEGFEQPGYCIRLGMNIYGTADAPRAYHRDFDKYLAQCLVFPEQADTCLYTSQNPRYPGLQLIEYVDDLVCRGSALAIENFIHDLKLKYEIRDYGEPKSFLGMEINRDRKARTIHLTQTAYIQQLAREHGLLDSNYIGTPMTQLPDDDTSPLLANPSKFRQIVGELMYCHMATRFDCTHAVATLSRNLARPTEQNYAAAKRVVQYLYHHQQIGPTYRGGTAVQLLGYTDADYAGDVTTRRSTSGRVFMFMQGTVSWASKQQRTVATSTAQSEYVAMAEAAKEAVWRRKVVTALMRQTMPTTTILLA
jgi:hypothetical protein